MNNLGKKPYRRLHRDYVVLIQDQFLIDGRFSEGRRENTRSDNEVFNFGLNSETKVSPDSKEDKFKKVEPRKIEEDIPKNVSDFTLNIDINYDLENPPASCDITIQTPRHKIFAYDLERREKGLLEFKEFDEVKVFAKTRFRVGEEGFKYIQIFRGMVIGLSETSSAADNQVTLNCADMLHWWKMMRFNVNPSSFTRSTLGLVGNGIFRKAVFGELNAFEIMVTLSQAYKGDIASGVRNIFGRSQEEALINDPRNERAMKLWRRRFQRLNQNFFIIGVEFRSSNEIVYLDTQKATKEASEELGRRNSIAGSSSTDRGGEDSGSSGDGRSSLGYRKVEIVPTDRLKEIRPFSQIQSPSTMEDEFNDRLSIALDVAGFIQFEFFQDTHGDIIFKPPYYNAFVDEDTNPIYVLKQSDIRNSNFSTDTSSVVTELHVKGVLNQAYKTEGVDQMTLAVYRDGNLMLDYGIQTDEIEMGWLRSNKETLEFAKGEIDRINNKRFTSSITIEGRPELKLGMPVYIPYRDVFYYIKGISHSLSGDDFSTTLTLDSRRKRKLDENGNVIRNGVLKSNILSSVEDERKSDGGKEKNHTLKSLLIGGEGQIIQDSSRTQVEIEGNSIFQPVSDSNGYELLGSFPYGKGFKVNRESVLENISTGQVINATSITSIETEFKNIERVPESTDSSDSASEPQGINSLENNQGDQTNTLRNFSRFGNTPF